MTNFRSLGPYLRECRSRLDPAALGYVGERRRTPGLRREEVALRAGISTAWYSWLEQGRGGAPSAVALDRIAVALQLSEAEREHLFLLGLGRRPEVRYPSNNVVPLRLQRALDGFAGYPALIRTATWDVAAWNSAATAVFTDLAALKTADRNLLRILFLHPEARCSEGGWEHVARYMVGVFRADLARAGNRIDSTGPVKKRLRHPKVGEIVLEFSSFKIVGHSDFTMLVWVPESLRDATRVRRLVAARFE